MNIQPNDIYFKNEIIITNEGKSTSDLSLLLSCNFPVDLIERVYDPRSQDIETRRFFDNYPIYIKINNPNMGDFGVLELVHDVGEGNTKNNFCNVSYSSNDLGFQSTLINFQNP